MAAAASSREGKEGGGGGGGGGGGITAASIFGAAAVAMEQQEKEEEEEEVVEEEKEVCVVCHRPAGPGENEVLSLLKCTGSAAPPSVEEEEEDEGEGSRKRKREEEVEEEEVIGLEPCGASYHPVCLPPGATGEGTRDEEGKWCCPSCRARAAALGKKKEKEEEEEERSDLDSKEVDSTLPNLGWRMQRGRFLELNWIETKLAREEDKAAARRALDTTQPPTVLLSAPPLLPAASSSTEEGGGRRMVAPSPPPPDAYMQNLLGRPLANVEDYEAEIRAAVLVRHSFTHPSILSSLSSSTHPPTHPPSPSVQAGDEAKAFRLAMQMMLKKVADNSANTRRSLILDSDIAKVRKPFLVPSLSFSLHPPICSP